ncbi:MAG: hypothetical protein LKG27_01490 [Clostridiaceae bacterium]|jgi:hypothetical protein|nr:hypothetical protein [Clostridiaceae bacterium]
MKVDKCNTVSFTGIYNSKILKKGLEFSAQNGALFAAGASLVMSAVARPAVILATPKTDKENKKLACAKSISSSVVGYLLMLGASLPVARAIKKIDKNPEKYLKASTIKALKGSEKNLAKSKGYIFATQLFKLGLGFLVAVPKSVMVCALIPPILSKMFDKNVHIDQPQFSGKSPAFKGLPKHIGRAIDSSFVKKLTDKFKDSNFAMHIMALTDALATFAFMHQTKKSKHIEQSRKKTLIYNSAISTGLSIAGGYVLDSALNKPTEKFIKKFSEINKDDKKLDKYVEGIKIAKPILILGGIYYLVIPFISTFLADRAGKNSFKH